MDDVIATLRSAESRTRPPTAFDLDAALRRGRGRARRRRLRRAGAVVVTAAAVGWGAVTGLADDPGRSPVPAPPPAAEPEDPAVTAIRAEAAGYLAVFGAEQTVEDRLPWDQRTLERSALLRSTTRSVGEFDGTRFYAALTVSEDIVGDEPEGAIGLCLVVAASDTSSASSCMVLDTQGRYGPGLDYRDAAAPAELLFDGHRPTDEQLRTWTFVSPNLAVEAQPACPPIVPSALPDGSEPEDPELVGSDHGPAFVWGAGENRVVQLAGTDALDAEDAAPATVRGLEGRIATSDGMYGAAFRQSSCDYTVWLPAGLTEAEARAYLASF